MCYFNNAQPGAARKKKPSAAERARMKQSREGMLQQEAGRSSCQKGMEMGFCEWAGRLVIFVVVLVLSLVCLVYLRAFLLAKGSYVQQQLRFS